MRVEWLEGYWGTVSYQLRFASRQVGRPLRFPLKAAAEVMARMDIQSKRTDIGHPKNYTIVATA